VQHSTRAPNQCSSGGPVPIRDKGRNGFKRQDRHSLCCGTPRAHLHRSGSPTRAHCGGSPTEEVVHGRPDRLSDSRQELGIGSGEAEEQQDDCGKMLHPRNRSTASLEDREIAGWVRQRMNRKMNNGSIRSGLQGMGNIKSGFEVRLVRSKFQIWRR